MASTQLKDEWCELIIRLFSSSANIQLSSYNFEPATRMSTACMQYHECVDTDAFAIYLYNHDIKYMYEAHN